MYLLLEKPPTPELTPSSKVTNKKRISQLVGCFLTITIMGITWIFVSSETSEKEQELIILQNKLVSNPNSFTNYDQEKFCSLMLEIKKISIPYCSRLPVNLLRNIISLTKDDLRFLLKFSAKFNPELTIRNQLKGSGQLRNFTTSPNLKGVDPDEILDKTTLDLIDFFKEKLKDRKIDESQINRIIKQLNKTMEDRDLNPVQRK